MARRWYFGLIAILVAAVIISFDWGTTGQRQAHVSKSATPESAPVNTPAETKTVNEIGSGTPSLAMQLASKDFKKWIRVEAEAIDAVSVDSDKKLAEIRRIVSRLTPDQGQLLLNTASNPKAPAREKILSTFLMVEAGTAGHEHLRQFIAMPLPDTGTPEPHSENEMKGVREKSLRIMAIDGLVSQARRDQKARETLAKTIPDIQDPYVRSYAEGKLEEVSAQ